MAFEVPALATGRLLLRRLAAANAAALHAVFSDPDMMRYWSSPAGSTIEQADQW